MMKLLKFLKSVLMYLLMMVLSALDKLHAIFLPFILKKFQIKKAASTERIGRQNKHKLCTNYLYSYIYN